MLQIVGAIQLRKEIEGEWLLGLSGLLCILFGVALVAQPSAGALAVVWMIASLAIIVGCLYIALHRAGVSPEAVQIADPLRLPFPRRRPLNAKTDARKIERG